MRAGVVNPGADDPTRNRDHRPALAQNAAPGRVWLRPGKDLARGWVALYDPFTIRLGEHQQYQQVGGLAHAGPPCHGNTAPFLHRMVTKHRSGRRQDMGKTGILNRFLSDRGGNFAVLTGMVMTTLAMGVGFAVNIGQSMHVKASLRNALDAAVTSTARDITTGTINSKDARPMVEAFLAANSDPRFTTSTYTLDTLIIDDTKKTITATASAHVDIAFPLFSIQNPKVEITSASLYSDKTIEVAMVLDVTGSMAGQKIKDLKAAATNAATTFLSGQDPANPRVRLAIVPYSASVNTGPLQNTVYVETRFTTGEPPAIDDPRAVATAPDACATERKGSQQYTDAGPDTAMVNRDYRLSLCPTASLAPLSADLAKVKATINAFSANGSTAGHIGIQLGWYMLSPEWNSVLAKKARPTAYNDKKSAKFVIIMTDGEFNTAYSGVGRSGDTGAQEALSGTHAEALCAAMKDKGIEVFTIGFKLDRPSARDVLKDCASDDTSSAKHYFETASGSELDAAFQSIARNIERLTLTQ